MRTAFIEQLIVAARSNPRIFLVVGDLGYSVVEPFAAEFPDRYLNAGVAEQNMTGLAAGLAAEGFHVFTYSIGNFPTLRCFEQIRNDVCYHKLPVTIVAVGAGVSYGNLGYSHHCVQDIACLRTLPGLSILSPADPGETRHCVEWLSKNPCPSYLRLGKAGEPRIHDLAPDLQTPLKVRNQRASAAIVATGSILCEAVAASDQLAEQGIAVDVFSLTRLSPLTSRSLVDLSGYQQILTVEEHVSAGGVGEMCKSLLPRSIDVRNLSVSDELTSLVGSQSWLRAQAGLDACGIVAAVKALVAGA
ncbi:MAG TPA: transketolase [Planctomycetaceae bacterium]|nr:transketolase [Planctomycetaceae bacterium]